MEFASQDTLRAFLSRWLKDHGHTVYCQVPCPDGAEVDILTEDYLIDCCPTLTPAALETAARKILTHQPHFPDQQMVVAGLSPSEAWDQAYQVADQLQGVQVWFVDQMKPFLDYYRQHRPTPASPAGSPPVQPVEEGRRSAIPVLDQHNPLTGCLMSLGIATILGLSFWLAYTILNRQQQVTPPTQTNQAWEGLHAAVAVWDINTSLTHLASLRASRNPCVAEFADRFTQSLEQRGNEGFRDINPIKRALNQQDGCQLEMPTYDFSP
jgi:hypothetical protein